MEARKVETSRDTRAVSAGSTVTLMRRLRPLRVQMCRLVVPTSLAMRRISLSSSTAAESTLPLPTASRPALRSGTTRVSPANISISPAKAALRALAGADSVAASCAHAGRARAARSSKTTDQVRRLGKTFSSFSVMVCSG
jgi:hypothetical protein